MTGTTVDRAPALPETVNTGAIAEAFSLGKGSTGKDSLQAARERLFTDVTKSSYIFDHGQGLGTTLKRVMGFIFSFSFYTGSQVSDANRARQFIRDPQNFTRAIHMLNGIGNTAEDAAKGIITESQTVLENGSKTAATKDDNQTKDAIEKYQKILGSIDRAIDRIVSEVPAGEQKSVRRAIYAALAAQAMVTEFKTEFGGDPRVGLSDVHHAGSISEQQLAIDAAKLQWYQGNALVAGREIASKVTGVGDMSGMTTAQRVTHLRQAVAGLEARQNDIYAEAAQVLELQGRGGEIVRNPDGTYSTNPVANASLFKEVAAIRERYADEVSGTADREIAGAASRINEAHNLDLLKQRFLEDRKQELRELAGSGVKGEAQLVDAIRFIHVDASAKRATATALGVSPEVLEDLHKKHVKNSDEVKESLRTSTEFLSKLTENFAEYVAEKRGAAEADANYIAALLHAKNGKPSGNGTSRVEQENARIVKALRAGEEVKVNGITIKAKVDKTPEELARLADDTIKTSDLKELLMIVLGNGKGVKEDGSKPGSAMLTAALMSSLSSKPSRDGKESRLADVFAEIGTENLSGPSATHAANLAQARRELAAAQSHVSSFWRKSTSEYKAAVRKRDALQAHVARLETAPARGFDAYVVVRPDVGEDANDTRANQALKSEEYGLNMQFNNAKEAIKQLRQALGLVAAETASTASTAEVDGAADVSETEVSA